MKFTFLATILSVTGAIRVHHQAPSTNTIPSLAQMLRTSDDKTDAEMFAIVDADNDGFVTYDEYIEFFEAELGMVYADIP